MMTTTTTEEEKKVDAAATDAKDVEEAAAEDDDEAEDISTPLPVMKHTAAAEEEDGHVSRLEKQVSRRKSTKPRRCSELIEDFTALDEFADLEYEDADEYAAAQKENVAATEEATPAVSPGRPRPTRQYSILIETGDNDTALQRPSHVANRHRRSSMIIEDPNEISYHPSGFVLYRPPRQRQRWGQRQELPRVNWGDLFFDLFYVAAAYNASNILTEDPSATGCLYFLATFVNVQHIWRLKMGYDARFVVEDDLVHRLAEVANLVGVAAAVVHIRPLSVMSNTSKYIDMFAFGLALTFNSLVNILRHLEIAFLAKGQRDVLWNMGMKECKISSLGFILFLTSTILSGKDYFSYQRKDDSDSYLAGYDKNATDYDARFLAEKDDKAEKGSNLTDTPMWLIMFAPVMFWFLYFIRFVIMFPNDGTHKKYIIPMNVDFSIHREAEWTMLMLGESILSLLIVDIPNENQDYFVTFYCSLFTVMLLCYLHFRSMPHSADDHVMRRSKNRAFVWLILTIAYSCALVAIGAAFTLFVLSFSREESDSEAYRALELDNMSDLITTRTTTSLLDILMNFADREAASSEPSLARRFLAAGDSKFSPENLEIRAANLFSASLAAIFFCLDGMSLMHIGFKHSQKRCQCSKSKQINYKGTFLVACRVGLIIFVATLSQWETDPQILAFSGLIVTICQIICRKLGQKFLNKDLESLTDSEDGSSNDDDDSGILRTQEQPSERNPQIVNTIREDGEVTSD